MHFATCVGNKVLPGPTDFAGAARSASKALSTRPAAPVTIVESEDEAGLLLSGNLAVPANLALELAARGWSAKEIFARHGSIDTGAAY